MGYTVPSVLMQDLTLACPRTEAVENLQTSELSFCRQCLFQCLLADFSVTGALI